MTLGREHIDRIISKSVFSMAGISTYHGTSGNNLAGILENGLIAFNPSGTGIHGVYLTKDLEKAARYAVEGTGNTNPIILELFISNPKRVRKIFRDPLDTEEEFLYDDYFEGVFSESLRYFERSIGKVFGVSYSYELPKNIRDYFNDVGFDLRGFRGFNVYKEILRAARNSGMDVDKVKSKMFSLIPVGANYEYFEIADDGSVVPTEMYFDVLHQAIYPKNIPPKAIKNVWVAYAEDHPGEKMSVKTKLLPQETRGIFEYLMSNFHPDSFTDEELGDADFREDIIEKISSVDYGDWYKDLVDDLKEASSNEDIEGFARTLFHLNEAVSEDWFEPQYGKEVVFTKMSPQEALEVVSRR